MAGSIYRSWPVSGIVGQLKQYLINIGDNGGICSMLSVYWQTCGDKVIILNIIRK
jgi:hypothetical protein